MKARLFGSYTPVERFANLLALGLIGIQVALIIGYYTQLSDTIPVHFGLNGKPDRWGGRATLFVVPGISVFIFLLFWVIRRLPGEYYNFPAPTSTKNRAYLVRKSQEMMARFVLITLVFMAWTLWNWIRSAANADLVNEKWLPSAFLVTSLAGIIISHLWLIYRRT